MSWDRSIDLFINVGFGPGFVLLASHTSLQPAERPVLVSGDKHLVRLWFVQPGAAGAAPTLLSLAVGDVVVLSGKSNALEDEALLFSATGFVESSTGGVHYEAELDLTTAELLEALGDESSLLTVVEVEVQNNANSSRRTRQFTVRVNRGLYNGESDPTPSTPAYPSADALVLKAPALGAYRVKTSGAGVFLQLKHASSGKFHSFFVTGAEGAETLALGPGED